MHVTDGQRWSDQVSDLRADGEAGTRFLTFFEFWFETAETLMWEGTGGQSIPEPNMTTAEAVRMALQMAEQQYGFLTTDLIGAMLTVASMHWEHGPQMTAGLTAIEHRVMEESLARKIADLQEQAQEH